MKHETPQNKKTPKKRTWGSSTKKLSTDWQASKENLYKSQNKKHHKKHTCSSSTRKLSTDWQASRCCTSILRVYCCCCCRRCCCCCCCCCRCRCFCFFWREGRGEGTGLALLHPAWKERRGGGREGGAGFNAAPKPPHTRIPRTPKQRGKNS